MMKLKMMMKKLILTAATSLAALVLSTTTAHAHTVEMLDPGEIYEADWDWVNREFDVDISFRIDDPNIEVGNNQDGFEMRFDPNPYVENQPVCSWTSPISQGTEGGWKICRVIFSIVSENYPYDGKLEFPYDTFFHTQIYFRGKSVARNVQVLFPAGTYGEETEDN